MTTLQRIANHMIHLARNQGWAGHTLPRGLRLFLKQNHAGRFHLSVSRENASPSPTEIEVIRRDFDVPPEGHEYVNYHIDWSDQEDN